MFSVVLIIFVCWLSILSFKKLLDKRESESEVWVPRVNRAAETPFHRWDLNRAYLHVGAGPSLRRTQMAADTL